MSRRSTIRRRRERKRRKHEQQRKLALQLRPVRKVSTAEIFLELNQRAHILAEVLRES
jgi:hypothetical protein